MGNPKKPAALAILQGNPGKRPINKSEPKPERKAPLCPPHLDEQAKQIWKDTVAVLQPLGLIAITDVALLALYSQTYSIWLTLTAELKRDGAFIMVPCTDKTGEPLRDFNDKVIMEPIKNPRMSEMRLLAAQLRLMASDFGMTPSARARLSVPEKSDDPMTAWENRKGTSGR